MIKKLLYKLRSGKNPKFIYFLVNILRQWQPKFLFRMRLERTLATLDKRADKEYILSRVDYYNKLQPGAQLPDDAPILANHKVKKPKVYFYDTYEYTRWFSPSFKWGFCPGDVIFVPDYPSVVKSRPLQPDNANSVVLNLDKVRHFTFVKDYKKFTDKKDLVIFRGKVVGKECRVRFMEKFFSHPMCDLGDVSKSQKIPAEWKTGKMTIREHLDYKFIMALEGNDVASNLKWVMSSNSLAVMPRPTCETWYMEGKLIPNYHYVEIKPDYSDFEERINYYIAHPDEAQKIIDNAHEWVAQFRNKKREKLISLLVLDKYFKATGQKK